MRRTWQVGCTQRCGEAVAFGGAGGAGAGGVMSASAAAKAWHSSHCFVPCGFAGSS